MLTLAGFLPFLYIHFLFLCSIFCFVFLSTAEFSTYLNFCRSLRFDDKPDYSYLRQLFRNLFHRQGFSYDYVFDWNMLKFVSFSLFFLVSKLSLLIETFSGNLLIWPITFLRAPVDQLRTGIVTEGPGTIETTGLEEPPGGLRRGASLRAPPQALLTESGMDQSKPSQTRPHGSSNLVGY